MTIEEAKLIMQNELDCVLRNETGKCNRDCANCDLVLPTKDVILAYRTVIEAMEHLTIFGAMSLEYAIQEC